jgi:putative iron-dependent peroxidase
MMVNPISQPSIFAAVPAAGRSLVFRIALDTDPKPAVLALAEGFDPSWGVLGLGEPLLQALGTAVPGLRSFPALSGPGCAVPSTQQALWIHLMAPQRGAIFDRSELVVALLAGKLLLDDAMDTFRYDGRDLTGY